jgi:hypothetical protein
VGSKLKSAERAPQDPVQYLIVDSYMPGSRAKVFWSPRIETATPFSSPENANYWKNAVVDATDVIAAVGKWYVIKDSK